MNGSIIDELKVVISADYSSLKVSLDQGLNALKDFMSEANSGQIDWVNILQGTFTPALIATIASTFALSMEQALNFQSSLQTSSLNTTNSLQANAAAMSNSIYATSSATGESANDIATALGIVGSAYKDTSDQATILGDLSQYAATEGITVTEAAQQLIPLLQNWGVTGSNAATVMAAIGQSTANGIIPLQTMIDLMTSSGQALKSIITPQSMIAQLVTASQVPGFTPSDMANMTNVIVTGVQNAKSPVNAVFGDMSTYLQGPSGLGGAMDAIEAKIKAWGPAAQSIAPSFGLLANTISDNMDAPVNAFATVNKLAQQWLTNLTPLATWFKNNETVMDKLKEVWATIVADLQVTAMPAFLTAMLKLLDGADVLIKLFNDITGENASNDYGNQVGMEDYLPGKAPSTTNQIESGLASGINLSNPTTAVQSLGNALTLGIVAAFQQFFGGSVGNTTNNNTVNNNITAGRVTTAAASSDQLPSSH